jgi:O-antigen/teichoic acid export membrane protein
LNADPAESIRRNTAFGLLVQLSGAVLTGGLTLFLVRKLGPEDYGVFVLAVSVGSLVLLGSDFGISQSAARFIAERRADRGTIGDILSDSLSLKLAASVVVSAALLALAVPIANAYGTDELIWPLRLISIAVLGQSLMQLFAGGFEALGRNSTGFRLALSESALEAGTSIALVLLGAGVTGAAAGRAIGFGAGAVIGLILMARLIRPGRIRVGLASRWGWRRIAGYAGALLVIDGAFALFTQIDLLLIGALLDTEDVGLFGAPLKLTALIMYPGLALAAGVSPRLARGEGQEPNVGALETAMRFLLILQLLFAGFMLVWAEPLVDLALGSDYDGSIPTVRALAPYVVLIGFAPILSIGVNYMGEARRRIPLAIVAVLVNAAIDVILLPEIGIIAAAIGTGAATAIYVGGHLWICRDLLGLKLRPLALTFVRSLVAFAALCGTLLLFGTGDISIAALIGGAVAATIAYGAALVLTREISRDELAAAGAALRSVVGRGA